jgi:hypothetical protein
LNRNTLTWSTLTRLRLSSSIASNSFTPAVLRAANNRFVVSFAYDTARSALSIGTINAFEVAVFDGSLAHASTLLLASDVEVPSSLWLDPTMFGQHMTVTDDRHIIVYGLAERLYYTFGGLHAIPLSVDELFSQSSSSSSSSPSSSVARFAVNVTEITAASSTRYRRCNGSLSYSFRRVNGGVFGESPNDVLVGTRLKLLFVGYMTQLALAIDLTAPSLMECSDDDVVVRTHNTLTPLPLDSDVSLRPAQPTSWWLGNVSQRALRGQFRASGRSSTLRCGDVSLGYSFVTVVLDTFDAWQRQAVVTLLLRATDVGQSRLSLAVFTLHQAVDATFDVSLLNNDARCVASIDDQQSTEHLLQIDLAGTGDSGVALILAVVRHNFRPPPFVLVSVCRCERLHAV